MTWVSRDPVALCCRCAASQLASQVGRRGEGGRRLTPVNHTNEAPPPRRGGCDASRLGSSHPSAPSSPCPAPSALSGAAAHGAGDAAWSPGMDLLWPWKWPVSQMAGCGQEWEGTPWACTAAAAWLPPHPRPRAGPWRLGCGCRHPLVPYGMSVLPGRTCAHMCVHGGMQACRCAAEQARACKRVHERVCTAAGVCGHAGQWWGGCVHGAGCRRAVHRGRAGTVQQSRAAGRAPVHSLPAATGQLGRCRSSPAAGEQPPALLLERIIPQECTGQT